MQVIICKMSPVTKHHNKWNTEYGKSQTFDAMVIAHPKYDSFCAVNLEEGFPFFFFFFNIF